MSKTYSAGIVTAYGAAKRAGYQGTYEDFCRQQAGYAENAQAVEQAKQTAVSASQSANQAKQDAQTASTTAQQSAQSAQGSVQSAGQSAQDAQTAKNNAQTYAQSASQSAGSAQQSAQSAQSVLESIPEDYSDLSKDVDKLKADLNDVYIDLGAGKFIENGESTASGYYKSFTKLSAGVKYKIEITANTSGTYDLNFSTVVSAGGIVDTISGLTLSANVSHVVTYTPTTDVYFARLWVCDNWSVKVYSGDTSVWDALEDLENDLSTVENQLQESEDIIESAFVKVQNNNRLDYSNIIKNKRYNSSGVLVDQTGWDTSNAIPIESGETIYFSCENGTRARSVMWFLVLFSENDELLDYDNSGVTSYTAESSGYVRFTWKYNASRSNFFCGIVSDYNYYDEYGYTYIAKQAETIKPYSGVVWACVGDSMTAYNDAAKKHYFDYVSQELGFIVQNYGVSGTGYAAQKENNNAFYQRILNISDPFDVLTIFGSVNDMAVINNVPLGTYEDSGTDTIGGCINAAIDSFYTIAPFKKLGIISQPPSIGTANNGHLIGTTAQAYNDLLKQICANRGIPFLDMFNCSGLRPWDADYRAEYYNEDGVQDIGVHPNSKGQKQLSTKIREFIKTLI